MNTQPKRPLIVMAGPLPPTVGGMATVIGNLAASSLREICDLRLFDTSPRSAARRNIAGVIWRRLKLWRRWWSALHSDVPVVAHIHTCSGASFFFDGALTLIARMRGVPVVLHIHGGRFDTFFDGLSTPLRGLVRLLARAAARVVVLSDGWYEVLTPRLPGARLEVVENGVPIPADSASNPGNGPPKVVFLGQLAETKGVFDLVAAAARVDMKAELVLAGPEAEAGFAAALHAEAERLNLGWTLSTPGAVQGHEKAALLEAATLFALPSYFEGLPMSLLEAMALGVPVVCTAVGGIPTVVENERSGLLVAPGDVCALAEALRRLLSEPELRDRLGRAGREVCTERFGIERAVEKLKSIYAEQLGMSRFECWGGVSR